MSMTPIPAQPTPHLASGAVFLEAIARHDFARLSEALEPDATMSALLPGGFKEWQGEAAIAAAFERWFGDAEDFEVADASVGQIGALLQLRWRIRLRATRLGDGPRIVEQNVFAATAASGLVSHLSLLCSGFHVEHVDR